MIGGFVYRGDRLKGLEGRYLFGDFSVLFKFPSGPHDYGRLFHLNPSHGRGLRRIREFQIARGNAVSLAVLGFGQDADGEVYLVELDGAGGGATHEPRPASRSTRRAARRRSRRSDA